MIFARESSDSLTSLVKKLDKLVADNKAKKMGSFVVFCSDDDALEKKLKELIKKDSIANVVLSIDNPAGPEKYNVAKDADITVVLYVEGTCKANWAFKKGEFKEKNIDTVVDGLSKILPKD